MTAPAGSSPDLHINPRRTPPTRGYGLGRDLVSRTQPPPPARRRGRPGDRRRRGGAPGQRGLPGGRRARRPRRGPGRRRHPLRRRRPRRDAARAGRAGGLPPDPGPTNPSRCSCSPPATTRPTGIVGLRRRRGRLPDQAVQPARAGGPGRGPAAAGATGAAALAGRHRAPLEACGWSSGRLHLDVAARRVIVAGTRGPPDPHRVRPALRSGPPPRTRSSSGSSCWPRSGTGPTPASARAALGTRRPGGRQPRQGAAPQDRRRADPDRARRRLRAGGPAVTRRDRRRDRRGPGGLRRPQGVAGPAAVRPRPLDQGEARPARR